MVRKNFLKERRRLAGKSQKALAEEIGMSLATINRYENGSRGMDRDVLVLIADTLNVEPHEIFTKPEEEACNLISS